MTVLGGPLRRSRVGSSPDSNNFDLAKPKIALRCPSFFDTVVIARGCPPRMGSACCFSVNCSTRRAVIADALQTDSTVSADASGQAKLASSHNVERKQSAAFGFVPWRRFHCWKMFSSDRSSSLPGVATDVASTDAMTASTCSCVGVGGHRDAVIVDLHVPIGAQDCLACHP